LAWLNLFSFTLNGLGAGEFTDFRLGAISLLSAFDKLVI